MKKTPYENLHEIQLHLLRPAHGVLASSCRTPDSLPGVLAPNRHSMVFRKQTTDSAGIGSRNLGHSGACAQSRDPHPISQSHLGQSGLGLMNQNG